MKLQTLNENFLPNRSTLQELLGREDVGVIKNALRGYRREMIDKIIPTRDQNKIDHYKWMIIQLEKRIAALGPIDWHDQQVTQSGIGDIHRILDHGMFWITANGNYGWVPPAGHHEDAAFQAFGRDDDDDSVDWNDVAMNHGWVRGIYTTRGELDLEFRSKIAPRARRVVIQLIQYLEEQAVGFVIEIHTGNRQSVNKSVPDARSAIALIRQN